MAMVADNESIVRLGRVSGLYGVQGWVRIFSDTNPRENILNYSPWLLHINGEWVEVPLKAGRRHGKGVIAQLEGWHDRDQVRSLIDCEIGVPRTSLPKLDEDEIYWSDLVGLTVTNQQGEVLGKVDHLFETGANDVMVVKGEREYLIPFVSGHYIEEIDLDAGSIRVDWNRED